MNIHADYSFVIDYYTLLRNIIAPAKNNLKEFNDRTFISCPARVKRFADSGYFCGYFVILKKIE